MWSLPIGSQVETSMKRPHKPIINYLSTLSLQPGESKVQISIKNQPHQKINDASLLLGRGFLTFTMGWGNIDVIIFCWILDEFLFMRDVSFVDLDKALNFGLLIKDEPLIFHLFSWKMFIYHLFLEYVPLKEPAPKFH